MDEVSSRTRAVKSPYWVVPYCVRWCLAAAAWCGLLASTVVAGAELERFEYSQRHMGQAIKLVLYAASSEVANKGAETVYARFAELDGKLSDYQEQSELSRLSRSAGSGRAVEVSDDLWQVLVRARKLSLASDGAFDITVGPVIRLWRRARRQNELPSEPMLREAQQAVGFQALELDAGPRTAKLTRPGMRLDLGGIAVGFALDESLALLKQQGLPCAMIDASGDILAGDPPPGRAGWRVGVPGLASDQVTLFVELAHASITTSGDSAQHLNLNGRRYSHIIDPRTGQALTTPSSVTVIARDGITADSLATAVCVLGPEAGLKLIAQTPGAAARIEQLVEGQVEVTESKGWRLFIQPRKGMP
jgi:thiamine biosynthesis lipoprotein